MFVDFLFIYNYFQDKFINQIHHHLSPSLHLPLLPPLPPKPSPCILLFPPPCMDSHLLVELFQKLFSFSLSSPVAVFCSHNFLSFWTDCVDSNSCRSRNSVLRNFSTQNISVKKREMTTKNKSNIQFQQRFRSFGQIDWKNFLQFFDTLSDSLENLERHVTKTNQI